MNRKRLIIFIALAVVVLVAALAIFLVRGDTKPRSQLTGNQVSAELAQRPVLGVIIENTEPARPQTGLSNAGIVYEAVTEGGITRYLALYQEDQPPVVGPVRSLRVDTLDWAMGFDASIAHVGGRPQALDIAEERGAKSLTQFEYSEPYYRDDAREAPHNMYARTEGLRALQQELGHDKSSFAEIPRSEDDPSQRPEVDSVTVDYSNPTYRVEFRYDAASNTYVRYLAGSPHTMSDTEEPIMVKNLIVITMQGERDTDDGGLGSARALLFKDGRVVEGSWSQETYSERLRIFDTDKSELPLNRGKTWIAVIPQNEQVDY